MNELIEKITAPNGGVFTGNGTNTYLLGKEDLTLIDPGPKNDEHIDEIIHLGGGKINRILVTHTHKDHSPAALPISKILDVPMYGRLVDGESEWEDETFVPDKVLNHGDLIETNEYSIEVVHTPGHASNHLCFYLKEQKCLLTGDHIMDGSTVVIAPKDGNMNEYISSLKKLNDFSFDSIAPGHGNYIDNPYEIIEWTIQHRLNREEKVFKKLSKLGATGINRLLISVYNDVNPKLLPIAKWSLEAHLIKLIEDERVVLEKGKYRSLED